MDDQQDQPSREQSRLTQGSLCKEQDFSSSQKGWFLVKILLMLQICHPGPLITASDVWKMQTKYYFKMKQGDELKSR